MHVKATVIVKNVKTVADIEAVKAKIQVAVDELAGDAAAAGFDLVVQAKVETLDFLTVGAPEADFDIEEA